MSNKKEISWSNHRGKLMCSVNDFDVIDCNSCGFKHIVPIPTETELQKIYKHEYYSKEKPLYLKRHKEDKDWWDMVYSERYDSFEEHFNPEDSRILDIGSGPGFFLLHGKNRGWDTVGIEPSTDAVKHSEDLGLDIVKGFFLDIKSEELGKFNVIHMSEVLEHVPDPLSIINKSKEILTTGGILCIVVPNDFNPFQKTLIDVCDFNPWWIAPPHHINYFDFNSIKNLLLKTGFEILLTETTFPIDMFLLMGDNYIGNDELGRKCHEKRKTLELNLSKAGLGDLKRKGYQTMSKLGIGREVVTFARIKIASIAP